MGPYCNYCDHRCFVDDPNRSGYILATCLQGMEHDKRHLGYSWHDVRLAKDAALAIQECDGCVGDTTFVLVVCKDHWDTARRLQQAQINMSPRRSARMP